MSDVTLKKFKSITEKLPRTARSLSSLVNIEKLLDLDFGYSLDWLESVESEFMKIDNKLNVAHPALLGIKSLEIHNLLWRLIAYKFKTEGISVRKQCEKMKISHVTFKKWYIGDRFPSKTCKIVKDLISIERYYGLKDGTISQLQIQKLSCKQNRYSLSKLKSNSTKSKVGKRKWDIRDYSGRNALFISFGHELRRQGHDIYLRRLSKEPTSKIRKEWLDFVAYKTSIINPFTFNRKDKKLWKLTRESENVNISKYWFTKPENSSKHSATAHRSFTILDSFLSYCVLPDKMPCVEINIEYEEHHELLSTIFAGEGMNINNVNISLIADHALVGRYLNWLCNKTDNTVSSIQFLKVTRELLNVDYGFFRNYFTELKYKDWEQISSEASKIYIKTQHSLEATNQQRYSRNPVSKLDIVLESENPFDYLRAMSKKIELERPSKNQESVYAVWARDRLLINLLITNPLRANTISQLTFSRGEQLGMLRCIGGKWKLSIPKRFFKNLGGKNDDYKVDVSDPLTPLITDYLKVRHLLRGQDTNYLFRPVNRNIWSRKSDGNNMAKEVDTRKAMSNAAIYNIIRSISLRTIGVSIGTHGFRHIVATAWLKTNPEDYLTVSQILHDKLETVIANYMHLSPNDGLRRYYRYLNECDFLAHVTPVD